MYAMCQIHIEHIFGSHYSFDTNWIYLSYDKKRKFAFLPYHSLLINGIHIISRVFQNISRAFDIQFCFVSLRFALLFLFWCAYVYCTESFSLFTFVMVDFFWAHLWNTSTVIDRAVCGSIKRTIESMYFLVARFEIGIPAMFMTCVMPP